MDKYSLLLKDLKKAYRNSSTIVHYVVKDNSTSGYSLYSKHINFNNIDEAISIIKGIVDSRSYITFTRTDYGLKWVYKNIIMKALIKN